MYQNLASIVRQNITTTNQRSRKTTKTWISLTKIFIEWDKVQKYVQVIHKAVYKLWFVYLSDKGHVWSDFTLFLSKLNTDWTPCRLALTPDWTPTALALTPALNVSPKVSNYRPQQKIMQIRHSKTNSKTKKVCVVFFFVLCGSWFSTDSTSKESIQNWNGVQDIRCLWA